MTALSLTAALAGSGLITAGPAQAATSACKSTSSTIALPGKPDVKVTAKICVRLDQVTSGYRYYEAWVDKVSWDGTGFYTGGQRFNSIYVRVRLEHYGTSKDHADEYVTSQINDSEAGSYGAFYDSATVRTTSTNWTADGTIYADVADDGKGHLKYGLAGTATVR
ncbi:hypothetical protein [Streptomyces sp. NPDC002889]|uniref:hypothetical protein n=1 Tax=Streptomyces sp. NPDC002889 TaxID=3364669 RepID=UPI0036955164